MSRKVRVGVIGTGFGARVILPSFLKDKRCEVAVVCSGRLANAQRVAAQYRIPKAVDDWKKVVSDRSIDAVAIAVPADLQPKIALSALKKGKALFCEKPAAAKVSDARKLAQAAAKARRANTVDFEYPEIPAWQAAKKLIDAKKLGKVRHAVVTWQTEIYVNKHHTASWKTEVGRGGGALRSFASHTFNYLEWLLGPIAALTGRLRKAEGLAGDQDSLCMMRLAFRSGIYANVTVCTHAVHGSGHVVEIYGDKGMLRLENGAAQPIDDTRLYFASASDKAPKRVSVPASKRRSASDGRIGAVASLASRFLDAVQKKKTLRPDLADGLRVQELIDAAQRSSDKGGKAMMVPKE